MSVILAAMADEQGVLDAAHASRMRWHEPTQAHAGNFCTRTSDGPRTARRSAAPRRRRSRCLGEAGYLLTGFATACDVGRFSLDHRQLGTGAAQGLLDTFETVGDLVQPDRATDEDQHAMAAFEQMRGRQPTTSSTDTEHWLLDEPRSTSTIGVPRRRISAVSGLS